MIISQNHKFKDAVMEYVYYYKKYPGYDIVGHDQADVAFMVIQHEDLAYQEKYFPLVEKAVNDRQLYNPCYAN